LLRDSGRRDETRAMLAEIYDWFTEGFDTADLRRQGVARRALRLAENPAKSTVSGVSLPLRVNVESVAALGLRGV
jgi:hypothetical protein